MINIYADIYQQLYNSTNMSGNGSEDFFTQFQKSG